MDWPQPQLSQFYTVKVQAEIQSCARADKGAAPEAAPEPSMNLEEAAAAVLFEV